MKKTFNTSCVSFFALSGADLDDYYAWMDAGLPRTGSVSTDATDMPTSGSFVSLSPMDTISFPSCPAHRKCIQFLVLVRISVLLWVAKKTLFTKSGVASAACR